MAEGDVRGTEIEERATGFAAGRNDRALSKLGSNLVRRWVEPPKYNPARRKTFAIADWVHVCRTTSATLADEGALELAAWADTAARNPKPAKKDQDQLDACICLVSAATCATMSTSSSPTSRRGRI